MRKGFDWAESLSGFFFGKRLFWKKRFLWKRCRCWLPDRRRPCDSRPGQRCGAAKLPQGFELAIYEIRHAGELRRHDLLDTLSMPGNRGEAGCGLAARSGRAGCPRLAPRDWRNLDREVFRRKVQMVGHGIERRKVAHHLAKAHGDIEAGLDGLARLREEQGIEAELKETCAARCIGYVNARKILKQSREFCPNRRLAVGRLGVLPNLDTGAGCNVSFAMALILFPSKEMAATGLALGASIK